MTHQDSSKPRPVDHEEIDQAVDEEKQTQDVVQDDSRSVQLTGHVGDVTPNPEINTPAEKSFSPEDSETLTSPQPVENTSIIESLPPNSKLSLGELALGEQWRCVLCDHLEAHSTVRCSQCHYWRADISFHQPLDTSSVYSEHVKATTEKLSDKEVLDTALSRLQRLFIRAQSEGRSLGDAERARLYEALLLSLFRIERTSIKKMMIKDLFRTEREERRRAHMVHLSMIWFLGICTGFALYFGLQSVSG